jgi:Inner membrane component of T3SS, cytoplasmic domain
LPKLIIKLTHQKSQLYRLAEGPTVIGRGESAQVVLPNVSVSREHVRVTLQGAEAQVENISGNNQLLLNGKPSAGGKLSYGDELQVGRYTLVYIGDRVQDRFYKGRCVEYLPTYKAGSILPDDHAATFALTKEALLQMQQDNSLVETAKVIVAGEPGRFWHPEDRGLTFGDQGQIPVAGWFTWGVVARIKWDGHRHWLHHESWWVSVSVNDKKGDKLPLGKGDQIRIGASRFQYLC